MGESRFPDITDTIEFGPDTFTLTQLSRYRFLIKFNNAELGRFEASRSLEAAIASGGLVGARGLFARLAEAWLSVNPVLISPGGIDSAAILSGTSPLGFEEDRIGDLLLIPIGIPHCEPYPGWITLGFFGTLVDRAHSTLKRFRQNWVPTYRQGNRKLYWMGGVLLYYHQRAVLGSGAYHTGGSGPRFQPTGKPLDLSACVSRLVRDDLLAPEIDPGLAVQVLQARLVIELQKFDRAGIPPSTRCDSPWDL